MLALIRESSPGSAFEFWKEPPGKERGLEEPQQLTARMYYAFASGLGNLKQNLVLWVWVYFLYLGMEECSPLFFC
jgi:hypothetical protein